MRDLALNDAAEYLEMAARLLRIKAHMLLPRHEGDDAWEDPRAELVRRLLEYQQMREVVYVLERLGEDRRNRFARSYSPELTAPPQAPLALSLAELLVAVDRVLRAAQQADAARRRAARARRRRRDHHDSRGARAPPARALARRRARRAPSRGKCSRRCSPCSNSRAATNCRSSSPNLLPMWRSRVNSLAKLLEAALFASPRPIPAEELASLDRRRVG